MNSLCKQKQKTGGSVWPNLVSALWSQLWTIFSRRNIHRCFCFKCHFCSALVSYQFRIT